MRLVIALSPGIFCLSFFFFFNFLLVNWILFDLRMWKFGLNFPLLVYFFFVFSHLCWCWLNCVLMIFVECGSSKFRFSTSSFVSMTVLLSCMMCGSMG